ncbi:hypothetical protein 035JT004_87 [Bacillus phage 035JT004]|nr:hypothetical protein 035JT004_87 [Bacillus phage 035JT004]
MVSEAQVHMYMSFDDYTALTNGDVAFGYTKGYTEYNIHVSVPVSWITNVLEVSEYGNFHFEYEVQTKEDK